LSVDTLRENKADEAYTLLKNKIVSLEYLPSSTITELDVCQQLNMSRTPIRIALARLIADGFITEVGPKKNIVADVSVDSFINIFEIREALDLISVRSACYTWQKKEEIDELRRLTALQRELGAMPQVDARTFLRVDQDFHKAIVAMTRNELLYKELSFIYDLYWRYNFYSMYITGSRTTNHQHEEIVDAIEARDINRCVELTKQHLQTVKEHILIGIARGFCPWDMNKVDTGYMLI